MSEDAADGSRCAKVSGQILCLLKNQKGNGDESEKV